VTTKLENILGKNIAKYWERIRAIIKTKKKAEQHFYALLKSSYKAKLL
jgi:hypothetical protein